MEKTENPDNLAPLPQDLRRRAHERLGATRTEVKQMTAEEVQELVYDLQQHQAELEIINEDLLESQRQFTQARDDYAELYENAPVAYLTLDENFRIEKVNRAAVSVFGCVRTDLLGKILPVFAIGMDRDSCHIYLRNVKPGGTNSTVIRFKHGDDFFWGQLQTISVYTGENRCSGFRVAITDITEQKRAEDEVRQYVDELASANKELESFSYSISHDLRTPLRAIKGFSSILAKDYSEQFDAEGREFLQRINAGADRMSELIDDMLSLAKISHQEMNLQEIDISGLAGAVVNELRLTDHTRKVDVIITQNLKATGDLRLLRIALSNLIGNAWKYSSRSDCAKIELGVMEQDGETVCYVRDNGSGFDMSQVHRLFAPFQRLHSESQFPGTGIGLAIVNRIIRRHGGRIWAEGENGKGATFYFTLSPYKCAAGVPLNTIAVKG